ncbi:MAG: DNA alkylation repair protein [Chloroflexota bacterium]
MPAIRLDILATQIEQLNQMFNQPDVFVRKLHDILSFYADHTFRPGEISKVKPIIQSYNVPRPVMRQIVQSISGKALGVPRLTLTLCDVLWNEQTLEFQLLAIDLIGQISPFPSDPIMDRIRTWAETCKDDSVLTAILNIGISKIRLNFPDQYFKIISEFINDPKYQNQRIGIKAIHPLLMDKTFNNYPAIFQILTNVVRDIPIELMQELLDLIEKLANRSPSETIYFLNHALKTRLSPRTNLLVRKAIIFFPIQYQGILRENINED